MLKPLEKLKAFIEKGARNNATDAQMHQTIHDHSVLLGATCAVSEAIDLSASDVMALIETFVEANEVELGSDSVALVETDETDLTEAKTRVVKLIAPGWGSSGYYPADVLKRDGPNVFKVGLHNFIDHPTPIEEKERPEGSLNKLASTLLENAWWHDDYKGNGAGLYSKVKEREDYSSFIQDFKDDIGMSIRASGKVKIGEADGKRGPIVESITTAKSVDYVTLPGAGGKVLELFESTRNKTSIVDVKIVESNGETTMTVTDQEFQEIRDAVAALTTQNARLIESNILRDARDYAARKLDNPSIKLHAATKARILDGLVVSAPLTEAGNIDVVAFNVLIETAINNEVGYLTSVGGFGKISGFGATQPAGTKETIIDDLTKQFNESMTVLDEI